ncbi:hypothetical protein FPV13_13775 (plasmid) [Mammaliicoccus sciuri]|uniref:hypothetical protein n=1 Tax=Mammaliicoccus sciuri TaxID=1296 RepID=UPI00118B0F7B|nr:hypothetical protein [Mammaliicoccus sciuri]QDR65969.1 hypothetical protein FPV13_13775 [Mammaliicoccus sciuri]
MQDILLEEVTQTQKEYLELLKELDEISEQNISPEMIDRINIFWYGKRNIVNLMFEYLFKEKEVHCFTAATDFDTEDYSQKSFFLLGDYHVFDDPLPDYLKSISMVNDTVYLTKMNKVIKKTVKNNIIIIENLKQNLLVFPLRHLSEVLNLSSEELDRLSETIFLSLFKDIESMEQYNQKMKKSNDIARYLNKNQPTIPLFKGDNVKDKWEVRLQNSKIEYFDYANVTEMTDGEVFFLIVFGNIRQALSVIDMSSSFQVIPFIRSFIPFSYFILISQILEDNFKNVFDFNQEEY